MHVGKILAPAGPEPYVDGATSPNRLLGSPARCWLARLLTFLLVTAVELVRCTAVPRGLLQAKTHHEHISPR